MTDAKFRSPAPPEVTARVDFFARPQTVDHIRPRFTVVDLV